MELKICFFFRGLPFCRLMHSTVFVKMKTFLNEESVLQHNKRNRFPSQPDHYLKILLEALFIIIMVMVVEGGEGGVRVASWYFVHIYGRWNEEAGTKITSFKITTEGGGGESMQRKTKSKMILAPPPPPPTLF